MANKVVLNPFDGALLLVPASGGGGGDVTGPGSATDNALVRFDGTTGTAIQNSNVTIADNGAITINPTAGADTSLDLLTFNNATNQNPTIRWEDTTGDGGLKFSLGTSVVASIGDTGYWMGNGFTTNNNSIILDTNKLRIGGWTNIALSTDAATVGVSVTETTGTIALSSMFRTTAGVATVVALQAKAAGSQTADIVQVLNSSNVVLSGFDSGGNYKALEQGSTPATPPTGYSKLYFKTDSLLYKLDDTGSEVQVGGSSGANAALSNLTTTAINESLLPGTDLTFNLGSATATWNNLYVSVIRNSGGGAAIDVDSNNLTAGGGVKVDWSGTDTEILTNEITSGVSGLILSKTGNSTTTGDSGINTISTGTTVSGTSGDINISTGDSSAGDSGDINLSPGTATGTRGDIVFADGSEGTSGHVWTSTDANGTGEWQAPSAGFEILVFTATATVGGAASEALTVTGLLATDLILSVTQKTGGGAALPLLGWSTQIDDGITGIWSADPGSGAVLLVAVKR